MSRLKGFAAYESAAPAAGMAPALQLLSKEHAKLRKAMEDVWEFASRTSERNQKFAEEWLLKAQKLRSSWNLHTSKEERILISALSKYVDSDRGPVAVMKYEHELMNSMFDKLEENMWLLVKDPGNDELFLEVMSQFRRACQISGEHCFKEENSTFALAQNVLSEAEKALILQLIRRMKL